MKRAFSYRVGVAFVLATVGLSVGVVDALAETERVSFVRKEKQRRGPFEKPFTAMATDRAELRVLWTRFDQRGDPPSIRFKKKVAILATLGGSGSCAVGLHDIRLDRQTSVVAVRMYHNDPGKGGACTDDLVPYTFTVAVARSELRPLDPDELHTRRRVIADPDA